MKLRFIQKIYTVESRYHVKIYCYCNEILFQNAELRLLINPNYGKEASKTKTKKKFGFIGGKKKAKVGGNNVLG